ncbi:unnamed protein product, partial [marine sediment metagenome]
QTTSFNNKMSALGITHLVLDEKYNQLDLLVHDITVPIKYGAPVIIGIVGYPRAGKSEGAQLLWFIIKQANKRYKNRDVELFLSWTQPEFLLKLNPKILKKGDVLWNDERPRTMGIGARKETWKIDNVMHSIAKRENGFIFVTPKLKDIKIDICDLYLETAGQNRKTKTNRFMILDDERRYFGHVYLKLHEEHEFREWYEKEKDKFIQDISEKPQISATPDNIELVDLEGDDIYNDLESIDFIRTYLRQNNNEITIADYALIINQSYKVSLRILKGYVVNNQLKTRKEAKGKL